VVRGVERGASQVAAKGASSDGSLVWNLPLDVTFRSTSAHGWPRLALSVYARDWAGRFVVRGYGSVLLPTVPGRHLRAARMFVPLASTLLQALIGWATGSPPEVRRGLRAAAARAHAAALQRLPRFAHLSFPPAPPPHSRSSTTRASRRRAMAAT
jgi:B9 domain-containing protein 1